MPVRELGPDGPDIENLASDGSHLQPSARDVPRRKFLTWLLAGPTLAVGARIGLDVAFGRPAEALRLDGPPVDFGDVFELAELRRFVDLVIRITPENRVEVVVPRAELGQGFATVMAMLVAEDLDARLSDVDVQLADADPAQVLMFTGGSNNTRAFDRPARVAAAQVRARLITVASRRWGVPAAQVTTRETQVWGPDGQSAPYGALTEEASEVLVPAVVPAPKPRSRHGLIGRRTGRVDAQAIVRGRPHYTLDLSVPGAVPTVIARPPTIGGSVASYRSAAVERMPGIVGVTPVPTGIAVSARTFHEALQGRDALEIEWTPGPAASLSDRDIRERLEAATPRIPLPPLRGRHLERTFEFGYLSHSPMEVQVSIADVKRDRATVWMPSHVPIDAQAAVAGAIGLPVAAVTLHCPPAGGSFGRRLFHEPAVEAAQVSKQLGRPVKLMWTREDDMRHGRFRPASHHRIGVLTARQHILAYLHGVGSAELDFDHGLGEAITSAGFDLPPGRGALMQLIFQMTQHVPYRFGVVQQTLTELAIPVPTAAWRSVFSSSVAVANEVMVDELATTLSEDPVDFRRRRLDSDRVSAVLEKVAHEGGWGRRMRRGTGQGIGVHQEYDAAVAYLVELDTTGDRPRATRIVAAVDVGYCINPSGLEAQIQGCAVDGLSTVLRAGNRVENGAIVESSFADFAWCRMRDVPPVEVHIISNSDAVGGAGELGYPAAAAAVANAFARATGHRPYRFPILSQGS